MGVNYSELIAYSKKLQSLTNEQLDAFINSCAKELAARLLALVIKRTPSDSGFLRRGWTGNSKASAKQYAESLAIKKSGNTYIIDIINPVEYASYVEYGHRTPNHGGWVEGQFMLTISEAELRNQTPRVLENKLRKFMKGIEK